MAYRFTNTDKWNDNWFSNLKQLEMLLFIYLCDNCDIAGFIEINYKIWAVNLNSSIDTIKGACKGLARGLTYSKTNDCVFINNFLKHQKNLPLNESNNAHIGIIKRFNLYANKFNIEDINEFIQGASKGLASPIGIGNGIGKDIKYKFSKFYDEEITKVGLNGDSRYSLFVKWLFKDNPNKKPLNKVLNLSDQIGYNIFIDLLKGYSKEIIKDTILRIENYNKRTYKSFNLTLRDWLKKTK